MKQPRPDHYLVIQIEGKEGEEIFELSDSGLSHHMFIDEVDNDDLDPRGNHVYATYDAWKGSGDWHVRKGEKALFWKDGKAFFHMSQIDESVDHDPDYFDPNDPEYF